MLPTGSIWGLFHLVQRPRFLLKPPPFPPPHLRLLLFPLQWFSFVLRRIVRIRCWRDEAEFSQFSERMNRNSIGVSSSKYISIYECVSVSDFASCRKWNFRVESWCLCHCWRGYFFNPQPGVVECGAICYFRSNYKRPQGPFVAAFNKVGPEN